MVVFTDRQKHVQQQPIINNKKEMGCTEYKQKQQQDPLPLINMLIVGLSGSGKSTILNQLKGQPEATCSEQLGIDSFIINRKIKIIAFEVAGRAISSWHNYYSTSNIVLFVIDSTEPSMYPKTHSILQQMDEQLPPETKIILVFNKIDCLLAKSPTPAPLDEQTSHVTQYLDRKLEQVGDISQFQIQNFNHDVYTCKCSGRDRIGVNHLMRKIFGLACGIRYGDQLVEDL